MSILYPFSQCRVLLSTLKLPECTTTAMHWSSFPLGPNVSPHHQLENVEKQLQLHIYIYVLFRKTSLLIISVKSTEFPKPHYLCKFLLFYRFICLCSCSFRGKLGQVSTTSQVRQDERRIGETSRANFLKCLACPIFIYHIQHRLSLSKIFFPTSNTSPALTHQVAEQCEKSHPKVILCSRNPSRHLAVVLRVLQKKDSENKML